MEENELKKFVENMRNRGVDDDEIERNLTVAGHSEITINGLLGRNTAPEGGTSATPETPVVDPNNRPQIIKDRSGELKKEAGVTPAADTAAEPGTPEPAPEPPKSAPKLNLQPQTEGIAPATINSPSTSQVTEDDEDDEPTVAVAEDTLQEPAPAAHAPATQPGTPAPVGMPMPAPQGMPAAPVQQHASQPIYPDATKGRGIAPQTPGATDPQNPSEQFPEYESNPFALFADSAAKFIKHAPHMILGIIFGVILAFVFIFIIGVIIGFLGNSLNSSSTTTSGLVGFGGLGGGIAIAIIGTILYVAGIAVYLTLYRTIQLSLALDIARGDKPDIGGAFNRLFTWFGRIFSANFRLLMKFVLIFIVIALVFWLVAWTLLSNGNYSGFDGLGVALLLLLIMYVVAIVVVVVVAIRNVFVHLLMLDNGTNRASDSARDSIQLVKNPRRKHLDIFAQMLLPSALIMVATLAVTSLFPDTPEAGRTYYAANTFNALGAFILLVVGTFAFAIFDIAIARQFLASKGQLRKATPAKPFNWLAIVAIIACIAVIFGSSYMADEIDSQRRQDYYDENQESRSVNSSPSTNQILEDFDDLDKNGIPDDDQCDPDEFAFPVFEEFDSTTNESVYSIDCI